MGDTKSRVMYDRISMCAHSCDPSCNKTFDLDDNLILRARRALSKDEEVTISYLQERHLLNDTANRQHKLRNWFYPCACKRCNPLLLPAPSARTPYPNRVWLTSSLAFLWVVFLLIYI